MPIIDDLEEAHGHSEVQIVAFSPFIITSIEDMHGDTEFGNGVAILCKFLSQALVITEGGISPVESRGIRVVRLIE